MRPESIYLADQDLAMELTAMVNSEPENVCPGFGLTAVSQKLRSIMFSGIKPQRSV